MIDWQAFKSQLQSDPGKMLGFVLSIAVCFLLIWVLVVVQSDSSGERTVISSTTGRLDSLRLALNSNPAVAAGNDSAQVAVTRPQTSRKSLSGQPEKGSLGRILPTLFIMIAAIAALWFWIKRRNKSAPSFQRSGLFEHIASQELSPGQQLVVVKLNAEYWVLGTGSQGVRLLHQYNADQWKELKDQEGNMPEKEKGGAGFAAVLRNSQQFLTFGKNGNGHHE